MKLLLIITIAVLSFTSFAQAQSTCAFGETSWDVKEELESEVSGKLWYEQEHLDLSKPQRLNGLSAFERQMVLSTLNFEPGQEEQALLDFSRDDGYVTYFTPNADRRSFAMIASYPGDNEFGMIVEIKNDRQAVELLGPVAIISDGDLTECTIQRSQIR